MMKIGLLRSGRLMAFLIEDHMMARNRLVDYLDEKSRVSPKSGYEVV